MLHSLPPCPQPLCCLLRPPSRPSPRASAAHAAGGKGGGVEGWRGVGSSTKFETYPNWQVRTPLSDAGGAPASSVGRPPRWNLVTVDWRMNLNWSLVIGLLDVLPDAYMVSRRMRGRGNAAVTCAWLLSRDDVPWCTRVRLAWG